MFRLAFELVRIAFGLVTHTCQARGSRLDWSGSRLDWSGSRLEWSHRPGRSEWSHRPGQRIAFRLVRIAFRLVRIAFRLVAQARPEIRV